MVVSPIALKSPSKERVGIFLSSPKMRTRVSDGDIRYIRFFRPIDPACAGLYVIERKNCPIIKTGDLNRSSNDDGAYLVQDVF